MTLGNRIGQYRRKLGLTQEALAKQLEVTNQAVSKWESDQCCPDITLLPKLAEIFGITIDELFGREAPAPAMEEPTLEPEQPAAEEEPAAEEPEADPQPEEETTRGKKVFGIDFDGLFGFEMEDIYQQAQKIGRKAKEFGQQAREQFREADWFKEAKEGPLPEGVEVNWEDDDTLRVAIFIGKKLVVGHPAQDRIEFRYEGPALNIVSQCSVSCDSVEGSVQAGGDVNCDDVGGDVHAGGDVNCDCADGNVKAGGDVNCDEVAGNISAGGDVTCDSVYGNVTAGGDVSVG